MELRHLRYFVAVAEEHSFRRAAARLHISQPPLSRMIGQLEEQVGAQLFERTARGVELTDAGAAFLDDARRALRAVNDAVERSRRAARGELGHLQIAYYGSTIFRVLPKLITEFGKLQSQVTVDLHNLPKDRQIRALREGWLDIGFSRQYPKEPDVECEEVVCEPVVLAVASSNPIARRTGLPMTALRDEPMVVFPAMSRPSFADEVLRFCEEAGFTPNIVKETEDLMACLALVSAGIGLALVPISAMSIHLPEVSFVKAIKPKPTSSVYCVYRKSEQNSSLPGFLNLIRLLRRTGY
ncbi:LysR substrate-binding domain-containing protein [Paraburkholderia sp. BL17N1]|uniref:LysR substrate-binding domain-containing protein n=1 Tax=Paraburkholderia sp. BL17N1 TaxID=1938798 RepID=UPI000EB502EA|nr:LysR substrate-binding domain-containing protein [Paraburkholderia sp. BL17N1]RKR36170.1 LysR family transcriptional regulator [Paraburkholderia sp. BL17N1]